MTSPVDTTVQFASSLAGVNSGFVSPGALSGTVGALIPLLDAFLTNGWGTFTSVTGSAIVSGVVTLSYTGSVPAVNQVINVSGYTGSYTGLNGRQKITGVTVAGSGGTLTFATALTGTPTGTPAFNMAPAGAGWTKLFSATNQAIYQSNDVTSTQACLFVDDTNAQYVRVVGYDAVTSISAGTNPFPSGAQLAGGLYWPKSNVASATAVPYYLFGNGKKFYYMPAFDRPSTANTPFPAYVFGDMTSYKATDPGRATVTGYNSSVVASMFIASWASGAVTNVQGYQSKLHTGLGTSVGAASYAVGIGTYSGNGIFGPGPSPIDSSILLEQSNMYNSTLATYGFRGYMSGFYLSPQNFGANAFNDTDIVAGSGDTAGKTLLAIYTGTAVGDITYSAFSFLDVTGPWVQ